MMRVGCTKWEDEIMAEATNKDKEMAFYETFILDFMESILTMRFSFFSSSVCREIIFTRSSFLVRFSFFSS